MKGKTVPSRTRHINKPAQHIKPGRLVWDDASAPSGANFRWLD